MQPEDLDGRNLFLGSIDADCNCNRDRVRFRMADAYRPMREPS